MATFTNVAALFHLILGNSVKPQLFSIISRSIYSLQSNFLSMISVDYERKSDIVSGKKAMQCFVNKLKYSKSRSKHLKNTPFSIVGGHVIKDFVLMTAKHFAVSAFVRVIKSNGLFVIKSGNERTKRSRFANKFSHFPVSNDKISTQKNGFYRSTKKSKLL